MANVTTACATAVDETIHLAQELRFHASGSFMLTISDATAAACTRTAITATTAVTATTLTE